MSGRRASAALAATLPTLTNARMTGMSLEMFMLIGKGCGVLVYLERKKWLFGRPPKWKSPSSKWIMTVVVTRLLFWLEFLSVATVVPGCVRFRRLPMLLALLPTGKSIPARL